ncbi:MAG: glycosyltransferase family 2 protein [Candidatus Thiodiazotropha sp.]
MTATQLSAVIITHNEADRIGDCLHSLAFCDEILVVDSGSDDGTQELCRAAGARVVEQTWLGYGRQKRFAVAQAVHDWVLCIDADERITPALADSIVSRLQQPDCKAYEMPRCNRFMGRWLRHGEGYPDLSLRLFDRRHANWSEDAVHERVVCEKEVGRLEGDLLHESQESLSRYLEKQNHYTSLQAKTIADRGGAAPYAKVVLSPLVRFIKFYLLRLGFLDGVPGLVHIAIGCMNTMMKYAKAVELMARCGVARER